MTGCLQSGIWLERRQSGLTPAEGLKLEEHLSHCEDCRRIAGRLDALRALIESAPSALSQRARQRVLRNALGHRHGVSTPNKARWTLRSLGFGAVLLGTFAAAAAVAVWHERASRPAPDAPHTPSQRRHETAVSTPPPLEVSPASSTPPVFPRPDAEASDPSAPSPAPRDRSARSSAPSTRPTGTGRNARASAPVRVREPSAQVGELLRRARAALSHGAVIEARAAIADALLAQPTRAQQAEAQSLAAEAALVAGDRRQAQALYTRVAERYRDLDAGDNALFAAARLAQQLGDTQHARPLLQRYLQRYPHGQFHADVQRRLQDATQP